MPDNTLSATDTLVRHAPALPLAQAVDDVLAVFVTTQAAHLSSFDPALDLLAMAARDAILGQGKRLRPQFAWWGWRANHGRGALETVLPALASVEVLHAFALVHDDVMDRSERRRGRPSTHRALADAHLWSGLVGDSRRFGDCGAILVGDLCLVWADRLMAQALVDADRLAQARSAYDDMRIEAIAGQFLDVLGDFTPTWTVDRSLRTARLKTASYTVIRPLQFGAALAGPVDAALAAAFAAYGRAVGEAFQLCDDLLGAFGEPAVTGKPAGDDLIQGKRTVLLEIARAKASRRQLAEFEDLRSCGQRGEAIAARLAEIVRATGAEDDVRAMIGERIGDGRRAIETVPMDDQAREELVALAESVAWRTA